MKNASSSPRTARCPRTSRSTRDGCTASLASATRGFINDPVTQIGGLTYYWSVLYNPNTVALRLDSIVPAPGSVALLGLGGLLVARRRR